MDLKDHFQSTVRDRKLLPRRARVVVAVSGGVDSMVLLHLLHDLSSQFQWELVVAHFNHQLRGHHSRADQRLVEQTAQNLFLPCVVESSSVKKWAKKNGVSIEMAARHLRHDFLARVAGDRFSKTLALAHHADDQVELFFLRLLRGAGSEGLAGMKWRSPSPAASSVRIIRPLLDVPKSVLQAYALKQDIHFREDDSNRLLDMQRNRIRHELIPLLQDVYQPSLPNVVGRLMDMLRAESDQLHEQARQWLTQSPSNASCGFADLPLALQRLVLQIQLQKLPVPMDFDLVEHLRLHPNNKIMVSPDLTLTRLTTGRLRKETVVRKNFALERKVQLLRGNAGTLEFAGHTCHWERISLPPGQGLTILRRKKLKGLEWFDAEKVGRKIILRHWNPGDRFQPIGLGETVKLQDLFTNLKVPLAERRRRLLACTARNEIWWVEGLRISEKFKISPQTRERLKWQWTP